MAESINLIIIIIGSPKFAQILLERIQKNVIK